MDSPNLNLVNQFQLKGATNRYCMSKVRYPPEINQIASMLIDNAAELPEMSLPDDQSECVIFSTGRIIHALEIRQPSFVHHQILLDLSKEVGDIHCLNAFALPAQYASLQSCLTIPTGILLVSELPNDSKQGLKIYDDRGKEWPLEYSQEYFSSRVLWVTSELTPILSTCITVFGFEDNKVSCFSFEFDQPDSRKQSLSLSHLMTWDFTELPTFFDITIDNRLSQSSSSVNFTVHIAVASFKGMIANVQLLLRGSYVERVLKISKDMIYQDVCSIKEVIYLNKMISQPKFILQKYKELVDEEKLSVNLIVPISNNTLLYIKAINEHGLRNRKLIPLRPDKYPTEVIISVDISEKHLSFQYSFYQQQNRMKARDHYAICLMYSDGYLRIHDLKFNDEDKLYDRGGISSTLQLVKQLDHQRFFLYSQTFSMKHFLILGSDLAMGVYEMQSYQIN